MKINGKRVAQFGKKGAPLVIVMIGRIELKLDVIGDVVFKLKVSKTNDESRLHNLI